MARLPDVPLDEWLQHSAQQVNDFADNLRSNFDFERRAEDLRNAIPFDFGQPGYRSPEDEINELMANEQRMAQQEAQRQADEQARQQAAQQQAIDADVTQQAQSAMENRISQASNQPAVQDFLSY